MIQLTSRLRAYLFEKDKTTKKGHKRTNKSIFTYQEAISGGSMG